LLRRLKSLSRLVKLRSWKRYAVLLIEQWNYGHKTIVLFQYYISMFIYTVSTLDTA